MKGDGAVGRESSGHWVATWLKNKMGDRGGLLPRLGVRCAIGLPINRKNQLSVISGGFFWWWAGGGGVQSNDEILIFLGGLPQGSSNVEPQVSFPGTKAVILKPTKKVNTKVMVQPT